MGTCQTSTKGVSSPFPDLHLATWDNTVPFVPPITGGYVIKVYDGDTITVANRLPIPNSPLFRFSVRLRGINAAEMKPLDGPQFGEAQRAKDALTQMVLGKIVFFEDVGTEKYGRFLASVYVLHKTGRVHVNEWMVQNALAAPYKTAATKQKK